MIALQLAANALLLGLGYYWLGTGESTGGELLWSALVAIAFACAVAWLHGAAFAYFGAAGRRLRPALSAALRHLLPLIVAAALLGGVYVLLGRSAHASDRPAFVIASWLTLHLRRPVRPSTMLRIWQAGWFLAEWMVAPVLALPMIAGVAGRGWAGFRDFRRRAGQWWYWLATPVLCWLALRAPFWIYGWVPRPQSFTLQMTSFVLRLAAGYLLFVAAWLLQVRITSAGMPRLTQSSTAPSP